MTLEAIVNLRISLKTINFYEQIYFIFHKFPFNYIKKKYF
jgi:hypothetical protein